MATTQDLRTNTIIRYNGAASGGRVSSPRPRQLARDGDPELKNVQTGKVIEDRVRAGSDIEIVRVDHASRWIEIDRVLPAPVTHAADAVRLARGLLEGRRRLVVVIGEQHRLAELVGPPRAAAGRGRVRRTGRGCGAASREAEERGARDRPATRARHSRAPRGTTSGSRRPAAPGSTPRRH